MLEGKRDTAREREREKGGITFLFETDGVAYPSNYDDNYWRIENSGDVFIRLSHELDRSVTVFDSVFAYHIIIALLDIHAQKIIQTKNNARKFR